MHYLTVKIAEKNNLNTILLQYGKPNNFTSGSEEPNS